MISFKKKTYPVLSQRYSMRKKCPYSELFWSVLSRIWTEYYLSVFSPDAGKYGPE